MDLPFNPYKLPNTRRDRGQVVYDRGRLSLNTKIKMFWMGSLSQGILRSKKSLGFRLEVS